MCAVSELICEEIRAFDILREQFLFKWLFVVDGNQQRSTGVVLHTINDNYVAYHSTQDSYRYKRALNENVPENGTITLAFTVDVKISEAPHGLSSVSCQAPMNRTSVCQSTVMTSSVARTEVDAASREITPARSIFMLDMAVATKRLVRDPYALCTNPGGVISQALGQAAHTIGGYRLINRTNP